MPAGGNWRLVLPYALLSPIPLGGLVDKLMWTFNRVFRIWKICLMLFNRQVMDDPLQRQNIPGMPPLSVSMKHLCPSFEEILKFYFQVGPASMERCGSFPSLQLPKIILLSGFLSMPHLPLLLHPEHPPPCHMPCQTRLSCRVVEYDRPPFQHPL